MSTPVASYTDLATDVLKTAQTSGADSADLLVAEGTEFSVTVRKGNVETLKEAGSKGLGLRVFVGQKTASSYTSDFSRPALRRLVEETVGMARATGEDEIEIYLALFVMFCFPYLAFLLPKR